MLVMADRMPRACLRPLVTGCRAVRMVTWEAVVLLRATAMVLVAPVRAPLTSPDLLCCLACTMTSSGSRSSVSSLYQVCLRDDSHLSQPGALQVETGMLLASLQAAVSALQNHCIL